ncbi:Zinc finger BED domain-containing protein 2 [Sciurus carolinensis]|uniref:Zinc finger BED domain-containing protein 2 n=1 Tax=Sciurus carolinensis TaxID=30640 RepID=A0AA41MEL2_SCICA|nr:Zinc finger BED domain-containing protein 2 [Sciurus carolinensis]
MSTSEDSHEDMMRPEEEEEEGTRIQAKGDLEMKKEEEFWVNMGTTALWKHLKSTLEKSGHSQAGQREDPRPPGPQLPVCIEGDWGRLLEQPSTLALWANQREKEVLRRERAVEWQERAVERWEQALEEVERAILGRKWKVKAEKEACQRGEKDLPAAAHPFHFV